MPTEQAAPQAMAVLPDLASRRILRLALGTSLALLFSQMVAWPLSWAAPIFTLVILGLPLPVPSFSTGLKLIIAMLLALMVGMLILPFMGFARWSGILLLGLALFHTFYFTARGGSQLLGTLMTIGLTLVVTIGSVAPDIMWPLVWSLTFDGLVGILFVWIAHALLPDRQPVPMPKPPTAADGADPITARRRAFRSWLVTFPVALVFLFLSGSAAYTVVMIKVASLGQQANADQSRQMGQSLLESTFWGGLAAILAWQILSIWPSLTLYVLLVGLAGLLFGQQMFSGPGIKPKFSMWSYAYLTMLVILAPAVLDGLGSDGAGAAFWSRLILIAFVGAYGGLVVKVYDAFWPINRPA